MESAMKFHTTLFHRFESDGVPFAYVTPTAAVVQLDDVTSEIIDNFSDPAGADPGAWLDSLELDRQPEVKEAFDELAAMGMLRPVGAPAAPPAQKPPMPYPLATLVLNVTNKCNLSCTYCYEYGEDRVSNQKKPDGTPRLPMMTSETACKSVDFLLKSSEGRNGVSITFFGGETLLNFGTIRDATEHAVRRGRELGRLVAFSLTTNATMLTDEVIDFLVEHKFGVNISIDGNKGDQDRHRTFSSGRGSYDIIVPRVRKFLEKNRPQGRPVGARVTLTAGMAPVQETFHHLIDEIGFDSVGFAPVTSAEDREYALGKGHMGKILADFETLAGQYVEAALAGKRHGFSNLHDLIQEIHQGINKAHPCGAGLGLMGVSTEGELGLCHRFVESGEHGLGNIEDGIDEEKRGEFLKSTHISKKVPCHQCFARPHCSGGCYHEAYVRYKDPAAPNLHYCDWIRAWTDLGLRSYAAISQGNPEFLRNYESGSVPPVPVIEKDEVIR
ncbi:MAG TPA: quinohemoprotein amine dehydrogenase maturation protein [Planctomycetes bacterium]|nr:quinohemoprotein amine dehydrogenase maturation protein [Planctomycetota bacterium]